MSSYTLRPMSWDAFSLFSNPNFTRTYLDRNPFTEDEFQQRLATQRGQSIYVNGAVVGHLEVVPFENNNYEIALMMGCEGYADVGRRVLSEAIATLYGSIHAYTAPQSEMEREFLREHNFEDQGDGLWRLVRRQI